MKRSDRPGKSNKAYREAVRVWVYCMRRMDELREEYREACFAPMRTALAPEMYTEAYGLPVTQANRLWNVAQARTAYATWYRRYQRWAQRQVQAAQVMARATHKSVGATMVGCQAGALLAALERVGMLGDDALSPLVRQEQDA